MFGIQVEKNSRCHDLLIQEKEVLEKLEVAIGRQQVRCTKCDKRMAIENVDVIHEFYFEENTGCPAGTGRSHSRGKHFVCPSCNWPNKRNKRFDQLVEEYPDAFNSTVEEHE